MAIEIILFLISLFNVIGSKQDCMNMICKMHGTYQIAAICKDGIVIGTDTRCAIDDGNKNIMCYYDTVQKVFPFRNYAISSSGATLIHAKYLFFYYEQFEKNTPFNEKVSDNLISFFRYMSEMYPEAASVMTNKNKVIFAGYENKTPILCISAKGQFQCVQDKGFVCEDNLCDFSYNPDLTCIEMSKIIEQTIIDYVKKYQKEKEINTHVSILKLNNQNQSTWLLNPPSHEKWTELSDFVNAYKTNKISLHFTSEKNKELILRELNSYK